MKINLSELSENIGDIKSPKQVKKNLRKIAEYFLFLSMAQNSLSDKIKEVSEFLINNDVYELFPDFKQKVEKQNGKEKQKWAIRRLYDFLVKKNNRTKDFLSCISITETLVNKLKDAEVLIAAYKSSTYEYGNDSVNARNMTKKELKK